MTAIWKLERLSDDYPVAHIDEVILLVTPEELERLPNGTVLIAINGKEYIKGVDSFNDDLRAGHLAYGTLASED